MALAIDASSPAIVFNPPHGSNTTPSSQTTTTAAFSPPGGSLLLVVAQVGSPASGDTITLSGGGLTWTQQLSQKNTTQGGSVRFWTAPNPTAQSNITVSLNGTGTASPYYVTLAVYVLTGADTTTPVIASASTNFATSDGSNEQLSLTNGARPGGLLFACYDDYECNAQVTPTSADLTVDAADTLGGTTQGDNVLIGHRAAPAASTAYTATVTPHVASGTGEGGAFGAVIIQPPAYSIAQVGTQASGSTTQSTTITVTAPSGIAVGDFLLAHFAMGNPSVASGITAAPSGWTQIAENNDGTCEDFYYKFATSADVGAASYSWTAGSSNTFSGSITRYTGVDTTHPIDAPVVGVTGTGSTTSYSATLPAYSTVTNNALLICGTSVDDTGSTAGVSVSVTPGFTTVEPMNTSHATMFGSKTIATAGSVGTVTASGTASYSGAGYTSALFALRPAVPKVAVSVVASVQTANAGQADASITVPSGVLPNHLGVLAIATADSTGSSPFPTPPPAPLGWTPWINDVKGSTGALYLFTRMGGHSAGDALTVTLPWNSGATTTAIWYDTGGRGIQYASAEWDTAAVDSTTAIWQAPGQPGTADVILSAASRTATGNSLPAPTGTTLDFYAVDTGWLSGAYFGHALSAASQAYTGTWSPAGKSSHNFATQQFALSNTPTVFLRGSATAGNGATTNVNSLSLVLPSTAQVGDVAVMTVGIVNSTNTLTTPTGWTLVDNTLTTSANASGWLLTKTIASGDPGSTVTLTFNGTCHPTASVRVYANATLTGAQLAKTAYGTAATTFTAPSLSSVPAGGIVDVSIVARASSATAAVPAPTAPGGYALAAHASTAITTSPEGWSSALVKSAATGGSYGGETITTTQSSTAVAWTYALAVHPKFATLVDDFSTNSGNWTLTGSTISGGTLNVSQSTGFTNYAVTTATDWDLTGSSVYVKLGPETNTTSAWDTYFNVTMAGYSGANASLRYDVTGGNLVAQWTNAGGTNTYSVAASVAYNPATMQWLRFRESGGTAYWDYSGDGKTWTNFGSATTTLDLTNVYAVLGVGGASTGTQTFDNFNTVPSVNNYTAAPADNVGITDAKTIVQSNVRTAADSVGITDSVTATILHTGSGADSVGVTDAKTVVQGLVRAPADNVGLTDHVTIVRTVFQNPADNVGITDAVTSQVAKTPVIPVDAVGITDSVTTSMSRITTIADSIGIEDATAAAGQMFLPIVTTAAPDVESRSSLEDVVNLSATIGITVDITTADLEVGPQRATISIGAQGDLTRIISLSGAPTGVISLDQSQLRVVHKMTDIVSTETVGVIQQMTIGSGPVYNDGTQDSAVGGWENGVYGPSRQRVYRLDRNENVAIGWGAYIHADAFENIPARSEVTVSVWYRGDAGTEASGWASSFQVTSDDAADSPAADTGSGPQWMVTPDPGTWQQFTETFTLVKDWLAGYHRLRMDLPVMGAGDFIEWSDPLLTVTFVPSPPGPPTPPPPPPQPVVARVGTAQVGFALVAPATMSVRNLPKKMVKKISRLFGVLR